MMKIRLHKDESVKDGRVTLIRLADSAVGDAEEGQACRLADRASGSDYRGHILNVVTKCLKDLTSEDASEVLGSSNGSDLRDLRGKLEQYRFRPQWDGESTRFLILEITVDDGAEENR